MLRCYFLELWFTLGLQGLDAQEQLQSLTCGPGAHNTSLQLREEAGLLCNVTQTAGGGGEWERSFKSAFLVWDKAIIQMPQFLSQARLIAGK